MAAQQRGLADAVAGDEADAVAVGDDEVEAGEQSDGGGDADGLRLIEPI